jgi:hypothetical protein
MMSAYRPGLYVVAGVAALGLLVSLPGLLRRQNPALAQSAEPALADPLDELTPAA